MLTTAFYSQIATWISADLGALYLAIGSGEAGWDRNPPLPLRTRTALTAERFRKPVARAVYLDEQANVSVVPTTRVQLQCEFLSGEGVGAMRECGLLVGGDGTGAGVGGGILLAHYVHARLEKLAELSLTRYITLDLQPRQGVVVPGQERYLGNSVSEELHDTLRMTPGCQLDEIRYDRRAYFATEAEARALGYDYCAYCFGRELSER